MYAGGGREVFSWRGSEGAVFAKSECEAWTRSTAESDDDDGWKKKRKGGAKEVGADCGGVLESGAELEQGERWGTVSSSCISKSKGSIGGDPMSFMCRRKTFEKLFPWTEVPGS